MTTGPEKMAQTVVTSPEAPLSCSGQSFHSRIGFVDCANRGKALREGKWYCGVHDPVKVAERRKARRDAYDKVSAEVKAVSDEAEEVARRLGVALGVPVHVSYRFYNGRTRVAGVVMSVAAARNYLDWHG